MRFLKGAITSPVTNLWAIVANEQGANFSRAPMGTPLLILIFCLFVAALSDMVGCLALIFGAIKASEALHKYLLSNVMRWPLLTFDITPIGRIVNRFGYDVNVLDNDISRIVSQILICLASVCYAYF